MRQLAEDGQSYNNSRDDDLRTCLVSRCVFSRYENRTPGFLRGFGVFVCFPDVDSVIKLCRYSASNFGLQSVFSTFCIGTRGIYTLEFA